MKKAVNVRYVSAANNPSGYGSAARQDVVALFAAGVNLTHESVSQMVESTDYGTMGALVRQFEGRKLKPDVSIIHLTPDLYPMYIDTNTYNIGRLFFETDRLPEEWVDPCNQMDEIWVGSDRQADMIRASGVKTPLYTFGQPIDTQNAYETIEAFTLDQPKDFLFYSCFQWIPRKNPRGLLQAYWKEFSGNTKVALLIKTYKTTYIESELELIKDDIRKWKAQLKLKHFPKVYLVHRLLTDGEMIKFHKTGDVFINPSSGEGWNRVMQEAMLLGKPVISGDNGGITDYLTGIYYHRVESQKVQAEVHQSIPWYTADMHWWQLKEDGLRKAMRLLYKGEDERRLLAQNYVLEKLSFQAIGAQMKSRLLTIARS